MATWLSRGMLSSEAQRPAWQHDYDGVSIIDNAADRAIFTFTADR